MVTTRQMTLQKHYRIIKTITCSLQLHLHNQIKKEKLDGKGFLTLQQKSSVVTISR